MVFEIDSPGRFGAFVLALIGLVLLAVAVYCSVERYNFLLTATRVEGVVSALNAGGSHPQITFTVDGQTLSSAQGGMISGYKTGDKVYILFDAANPARTAVVDAFGAIWFTPLILGVLGLVFLIGGTWDFLRHRPN